MRSIWTEIENCVDRVGSSASDVDSAVEDLYEAARLVIEKMKRLAVDLERELDTELFNCEINNDLTKQETIQRIRECLKKTGL